MNSYLCDICGKIFSRNYSFKRHVRSMHGDAYFCKLCKRKYSSEYFLKKHSCSLHQDEDSNKPSTSTQNVNQPTPLSVTKAIMCQICKVEVALKDWKYHLRTNVHKKNGAVPLNENIKLIKEGFNERIETFIFENKNEELLDIKEFLKESQKHILEILSESLIKHICYKFNLEIFAEYIKVVKNEITSSIKSFQSKMMVVNSNSNLPSLYDVMADRIQIKSEEFQERDSGWSLLRIIHIEININQYQPLRGSSYLPLPKFLKDKKACVNIENNDIYCFKWAIISAVHPVDVHSNRTSSYSVRDISANEIELPNGTSLNFRNIEFPIALHNIKVFEEQNPNISVNVFGYEEISANHFNIVGPYHCTANEKKHHINLLLLQSEEINHYIWIKNISRLIKKQITNHKTKIYFCNSCLLYFYSENALIIHKNECCKIVTNMPASDKSLLKFEKFNRKLVVPFVVYADFECLLKGIDTCIPKPDTSSTTDVQGHIPCAFAYFIKCSFSSKLKKFRISEGKDAEKLFI